jgi:hypothetical protein
MGAISFHIEAWSIVPGPLSIHPPFDSTELTVIEQRPPSDVAGKVLAIPAIELVHPERPDWWAWIARWSAGSSHIDLAMTLFEEPSVAWGGFNLSGSATANDLLALYRYVHGTLPGAWLHNSECALHTADSFNASVCAA